MHDQKVVDGNWVCQFMRRLYEWEVSEVFRLRNFLAAAPAPIPDQVGCPVWNATPSGIFSVLSAYSGVMASAGPLLRVGLGFSQLIVAAAVLQMVSELQGWSATLFLGCYLVGLVCCPPGCGLLAVLVFDLVMPVQAVLFLFWSVMVWLVNG
ncbi:hypothetical protein LOK49_LG08G00563 [Camellia lanceoleosa]|uniref:Uncharacterized protein n=1 Tax=Camellia lanceoleosa TaxID=1840588 RepID=A0ACC0GR87_9ERIC|nr:hypothetical protein LOK49_LG08G00563 [Camellia lanceoleosa]